jgi:hypothetical protein
MQKNLKKNWKKSEHYVFPVEELVLGADAKLVILKRKSTIAKVHYYSIRLENCDFFRINLDIEPFMKIDDAKKYISNHEKEIHDLNKFCSKIDKIIEKLEIEA